MKLTAYELPRIKTQGLYILECCDECGRLLNQTVRYTITGKPQVYCSSACRDTAFFGDQHQARKHSSPGKCVNCGASLKGKRRGALYCDEVCRSRFSRKR